MANTVRVDASQKDIDSNLAESNNETYVIQEDYTVVNRGTVPAPSSALFVTVPFGLVQTATYCRLKSDRDISIVINDSGAAISTVRDFLTVGTITNMTYQNNSGDVANIDYEVYGSTVGSAAGGGIKTYSSTATAAVSDYIIRMSTASPVTLSLPTAVGFTGKQYIIKNETANAITIDPQGTETIDGNSTIAISDKYNTLSIFSNGMDWEVF